MPRNSTKTKTRRRSATTTLHATESKTFTRNNTVCIPTSIERVRRSLSPVEKQTVAFNIKARVEFKSRRRARMGVWEAIELLNTLVDESDPDVSDST